ncbi:MAG: hypothetical protein U0518_01610 [Candidatus Gracilibacteria bacterium]
MSGKVWTWRCQSCARLSLIAHLREGGEEDNDDSQEETKGNLEVFAEPDQEIPALFCVCCAEYNSLDLIEVDPIEIDEYSSRQIGFFPYITRDENDMISLRVDGEGEYSARGEYSSVLFTLFHDGSLIDSYYADNSFWENWEYSYDEGISMIVSNGGFHIWKLPVILYS